MGRSKTGTWIGGTGVVALLLLVAGWFLLVSPVMAAAGETRAAAEDVEADNATARTRIETLKGQFADLDASKAELAELQKQVPTTGQLAAYLRQVDEQAVAHGVVVTGVTPSTPELFAPIQAAPAAATATDGTTDTTAADGTDADGSTTAAAPAPAAGTGAPTGMVDVPITMTAVGSYANVLGWVQAMQEQTDRLLLVTSVSGTAQDETSAGGGKPATTVGDVELTITGYLYVLPGDDSIPTVTPEEREEQLPAADPNRNPLVG
jgi:hypothetical protein